MGMTIDEAIALVKIERECVNRNNQPFGMNCNRECGKCDLLQNTDNLIEMYTNVAEWLEELKSYRTLDKTNFLDGYNKVIDDFVKGMKKYMETTEQASYIDELNKGNDNYSAMTIYDYVDELAEQLKAGVKNEQT